MNNPTFTPEKTKEILKARAQALAREVANPDSADATLEIVEFMVAQERFAIESSHVREVVPLKELTPLPCVPPFVTGIINLRGQILSVIDIKKFFDLPDQGITDLHKVIILGDAHMELGILADNVSGVRTICLADIQPSLPTLTGIRSDYLHGITRDSVVILDVARIISDPRIIVCEEPEA